MNSMRTELFKAIGIQAWGIPYALISAYIAQDRSEAVAEAFAFRLTQANQFEVLDQQVVSTDLQGPNIEMLATDDTDAIDMLFGHSWDFSQLQVNEAWLAAFAKLPPPHAPVPELQPHQLGSWKRAMSQLRLRGLPDGVLDQMENFFRADDVRAFLVALRRSIKPRTLKRRP